MIHHQKINRHFITNTHTLIKVNAFTKDKLEFKNKSSNQNRQKLITPTENMDQIIKNDTH